ncbi:MAG: YihY/virulence factor BrkB family protein [Bacteroidales bacterium]|nr:YihY/virulence factor BrkB family protein [Bacteroidales bacterium]
MKKKIKKLKEFIKNELWTFDIDKASKPKKALITLLRTVSLGLKGFKEDKLNIKASALTYFTLLSIVPVLALGFGIAKGFGLEAVLEDEIAKSMAGQEEAMNYILEFTRSMLGTAKGGLIAGLGFVLLLWSVIKLLSNIENSFNTVWDIKKPRGIIRKFTDYLTIMMLGPIFMILAGSITVFISAKMTGLQDNTMFQFATPLFLKFAKIIPFIIIWIIFTLLYLVMPNTKVKFKSALIGGIIAGTIFQLFQGLYVSFQSGATRMNAIYGSFAALPLFLIWLQISWFVVLLGAEISFVVQNIKLKGASMQMQKLSISYQKKIALLLVKKLSDYFSKAEKAPTAQNLAGKTSIPVFTVEFILKNLTDAGIISKIKRKGNICYQPAMGLNNLSIAKITDAYEETGNDFSYYIKSKLFKELESKLKAIKEYQYKSENNILLTDIQV